MEAATEIFEAYVAVLGGVIPTPALNKWTQVFPVMATIGMGCNIHGIMQRSMEYAHAKERLPGDTDSDQDEGVAAGVPARTQAQARQRRVRSTKSLQWFRDPATSPRLLLWLAIAQQPMRLHYFLFRLYSRCSDPS